MTDAATAQPTIAGSDRPEGLTPRQIVEELDKYIIGQTEAKRMVAIALRNRQRRKMLPEDLRDEVSPKNIIMIGPTGVGKTEIARRLARLAGAPFIKVEASKYTEVGYVGRDVEGMIRDLVEVGVKMVREEMTAAVRDTAERLTEDRLVDLLVPRPPRRRATGFGRSGEAFDQGGSGDAAPDEDPVESFERTRWKFREQLRRGELEDREIELDVQTRDVQAMGIFAPQGGLEDMGIDIKGLIEKMVPPRQRRVKMTISEARRVILNEETEKLLDTEKITRTALERVEQSGIVFIDEIDKIAGRSHGHGPDVSREGVQRDILPIVEGSTVNTKYGMVSTDHILFIAAGAFHMSKPSDLIPELQGRFPLRVELKPLGAAEFVRILTEPQNALTRQYQALLATEGVELEFTPDGIEEIAQSAAAVNQRTENIGARRLHTVMEKVLEETSFDAPALAGQRIAIDRAFVRSRLKDIIENEDLSKFIL
ncbi:MAG: ATP-dependent protease ATPase subunit HslU [Candidatus Sumerlaeia bacterium]